MNLNDPLIIRILSYLDIEKLGEVISLSCDIPLRFRLAYHSKQVSQIDIAKNNLKYLNENKRFCSIEEPLYKAIEFGELLRCYKKYGECEFAEDCWVTRKAFCKKRRSIKCKNLKMGLLEKSNQ